MTTPPPSGRPTFVPSAFRPTADAAWIWSLAARSPEQAFQRLLEHDSIHLLAATAVRLRQTHFLLDPERAFQRACGRIAVAAARSKGDPPPEEALGDWFHARIDEAAKDLIAKDELALRDGLPFADDLRHYDFFVQACMVVPENSLFTSVQFNGLPADARAAFFALFIEHKTVAEALELGLGPPERLRRNAERSLDAAAGINPPAPSWRDVTDDTIGPWWAQDDAFDDDPPEEIQ